MKRHNRFAWGYVVALLVSCGGGQLKGGGGGASGTAGAAQGGSGGTAGTGSEAPGGTGGTAGIGGSGVTGGSGGATSPCFGSGFLASAGSSGCQPAIPACGDALCGNGQRDTCTISTASCPTRTDTEGCDGVDYGGVTCPSLGYGSGSPSCSQNCLLLTGTCDDCMPLGNELLGCAKPPLDQNVSTFGIAANGSEVGIAWIDFVGPQTPSLSFARLSPTLDLISRSVIAPIPWACDDKLKRIAVAPLASGWTVAVGGDPDVVVYALDATGQPVARTVVESSGSFFQDIAATPFLIPRPDGGPLMLWHRIARNPYAALIAADGRSASTPVELPVYPLATASPIGAAYLQGKFHVIVPHLGTGGATPQHGLTIVRLDPGGKIGSTVDILPDEDVSLAGVGGDGTDIRVVYTTTSANGSLVVSTDDVIFRRISSAGDLLTPAVRLGQVRDLRPTSPVLALGDDTVFLFKPFEPGVFGGPNDPDRAGWARVGPDGALRSQGFVARAPFTLYQHALVQNGAELLAAWTGGTAVLKVARLNP